MQTRCRPVLVIPTPFAPTFFARLGFFITEARKLPYRRRSCSVFAASFSEDDPVASTAPLLPHSPSHLTLPRESSLGCSSQPYRLNLPIILASVFASFALVAGILAWIATHPHKGSPPPQSRHMAAIEMPTVLFAPPAPPQDSIISATPAFHHIPLEGRTRPAPSLEIESAPLPPPLPPQPKQHQRSEVENTSPFQLPPPSEPKRPTGENYGTRVLFLNNQEAAAAMARHEHKLLFVMHISGNFEDSCFT